MSNPQQFSWRKSSRSDGSGNCVEVGGNVPGVVGVRDSKDPNGPVLTFPPQGWAEFVAGIRRGQLD